MPRNMHAGAIHYLFSSYVCIYEEQLYPENQNFSLKICPSWHIKTFIA